MAQFDIYKGSPSSAEYLVDLQDEVVDGLATRVVAPLVASEEISQPMTILNPVIRIEGEAYLLMTHLLAAIPASSLKNKVASANTQRNEIFASLDVLFTGI